MTEFFFALSAGRSGSQSLSHALSQIDGLVCLHEPHPQLVAESARFAAGQVDLVQAAERLLRSRQALAQGARVYGETNNRLALMAPAVEASFPHARYAWLVRDGRAFVASEMQRGAFRPLPRGKPWARSKWDRFRVTGPAVGAVASDQWDAWSRFERTCWLWAFTNRRIAEHLDALEPARVRLLRVEEFATQLAPLASWLGFPGAHPLAAVANRRHTDTGGSDRSPNRVDRVQSWQEWTDEQHETFQRHGGELMARLYPSDRVVAQAEAADPDPARVELGRLRVVTREQQSRWDALTRDPVWLSKHLASTLRAATGRRRAADQVRE